MAGYLYEVGNTCDRQPARKAVEAGTYCAQGVAAMQNRPFVDVVCRHRLAARMLHISTATQEPDQKRVTGSLDMGAVSYVHREMSVQTWAVPLLADNQMCRAYSTCDR